VRSIYTTHMIVINVDTLRAPPVEVILFWSSSIVNLIILHYKPCNITFIHIIMGDTDTLQTRAMWLRVFSPQNKGTTRMIYLIFLRRPLLHSNIELDSNEKKKTWMTYVWDAIVLKINTNIMNIYIYFNHTWIFTHFNDSCLIRLLEQL
jgi:hypothetical protein